jgi:formate hydrogenlyase subunit 3/multisubunit Na+/H+ antiporter MnhD subunit
LIGAVSICGLPPFNGFISEFLIYKSFFQGGMLMSGTVPLVLLVAAVGLAFVGGLATRSLSLNRSNHPLCRDNDLTLLGYSAASHMPLAAPSDRPEMCVFGIGTACMNAATSSAKSSVE